ncbi:hypothetical protein L3Q82_011047, partial [Scortum barcoo]
SNQQATQLKPANIKGKTLHCRLIKFSEICPKPVDFEAQTLSGLSVAAAGDVIYNCHPPFCGGGVCWSKWYDRDNPSGTGDWEHLSSLRAENPGEICDYPLYIKAVTTDTMTPAINTGETFY